jgi:hypothetical protein
MNDPISYGHFAPEGWDLGPEASLSDRTIYHIGKIIGDTNRPNGHDSIMGKREAPLGYRPLKFRRT